MASRKAFKRVGIVLSILLLVLIALLLTYRLWFPYALSYAASRFDIHYEKFEKLEDGRFVLTGISRTNQNFDLSATRVEAFMPDVWMRKVRNPSTNEPPVFVKIEGWSVDIHPAETKNRDKPRPERSVYGEFQKMEQWLAHARKWLPRALLLNGAVSFQDKDYAFQTITWNKGELEGDGIWPVTAVPVQVKARLTGEEPYQLYYAMHPLDFRARIQAWETNQTIQTKAFVNYKDNRLDATAQFATNGVLPATASVRGNDLKFPGELLKLKEYEEITGSINGQWASNHYTLSIQGQGRPAAEKFPPLEVDISLRGNTNQVWVEKALSTAPGLAFTVSEPIALNYRGEMITDRAEITVAADLEKIPLVKAEGRVEGKILLEKGERLPDAVLEARGRNISAGKLQASEVEVSARIRWPEIQQLRATARFNTNGSAVIEASGNIRQREISRATAKIEGQIATNLLPAGMSYSSAEVVAQLQGPITNLTHSATFSARRVETAQTPPMNIEGTWTGRNLWFDELKLRALAGPAVLYLNAAADHSAAGTNLVVQELTLSKGEEVYLKLREPGMIRLKPGEATPVVQITPLHWEAADRSLAVSGEVEWPDRGKLELEAHHINPELFQFFVKRSLSGLDLPQLAASAQWDNGPLFGHVKGQFSVEHQPLKRLSAEVNLELNNAGLTLTDLKLEDPSGTIAFARGFLPLSVQPLNPDQIVQLSGQEQVDFQLETAPNPAFWSVISEFTKVSLTNPSVQLRLSGTTRAPAGTLQFRVAGVDLPSLERELPSIGQIEGMVQLDQQRLVLPRVTVRVEDQPVVIEGEAALGTNFWTLGRREILPHLLDHARLHLKTPRMEAARFTHLAPQWVSPQGAIELDLMMEPGRKLAGNIYASDLATRPLPKIGVVEQIRANIALAGREVQIANLQGSLGGEVLRVTGALDFAETNLARGYPGISLQIQGKNVPLARNPDVILRSDLDLRVVNGTNAIPVITGAAELQDSFLLRDIESLVPGRLAGPSRRPPYFSIEQDPLDEWVLDVRVRGQNFLRVRSPFFQGQVSANMHVTGTAREPMALGEASISSGRIIFPFGTLEMRQALVSLTSENPYLPHVFAVAAGRVFGYDIRMEAEGPADEPVIEFSSVPSLTSEQIVLMLTTGQVPREDFGFTNEQKASKLAFFLGKNLLTKLNPGQPAEERLTIRSGEDISEQGRQTYEVEYKINDRWSLIGEYDRFDALNADVKFKVFSR